MRYADPVATRHELSLIYAESDAYKAKVVAAIERITEAIRRYPKPYVAFSGGKDSMVVAALAERLTGGVMMSWSDDELELPETVEMMSRLDGELMFQVTAGWARHAGWFDPWSSDTPWREPFASMVVIGMDVDDHMGYQGYDLTMLGTRASENTRRNTWFRDIQVNHPDWWHSYPSSTGTGRKCCPIWDWTDDDVWAFIAVNNLPVHPAYNVMEQAGIPRRLQRIGPLPLAPRSVLAQCWPDLLERLEARYGKRWR